MADAPEVVPPTLNRQYSESQSRVSAISPQEEQKKLERNAYEKEALSNDELSPKTEIASPETEETNQKIGYEHDDRAGSGMEIAGARPADAQPADPVKTQDAHYAEPKREENEWHFGFLESCQPSSLCVESIFCPCVLTGRTHLRLHEPDNKHFSSTNGYCAGCFGLCFLGLGAFPLFCFMTTAQRREIRYRYNIKGNNGEDCLQATFCAWCSIVQEEREVVWREEQKQLMSNEQLGKRGETMSYAKQ